MYPKVGEELIQLVPTGLLQAKEATEGEYRAWVTLGFSSRSMAFRIWVSLRPMERRPPGGHLLNSAQGSI